MFGQGNGHNFTFWTKYNYTYVTGHHVRVPKVSIVLFNNFIEIESEWHKISRKVYGLNTNVKPTNIRHIA